MTIGHDDSTINIVFPLFIIIIIIIIIIQLLSCVAAYCSVLIGILLAGVAFVNIVIKHYIFIYYISM